MFSFICRHFHSTPKTITAMKSRFSNERTKRTTSNILELKNETWLFRATALKLLTENGWREKMKTSPGWESRQQEPRSSANFSRGLESMQTICLKEVTHLKLVIANSNFTGGHFVAPYELKFFNAKRRNVFLSLFIIYLCDEKRQYRIFNPP